MDSNLLLCWLMLCCFLHRRSWCSPCMGKTRWWCIATHEAAEQVDKTRYTQKYSTDKCSYTSTPLLFSLLSILQRKQLNHSRILHHSRGWDSKDFKRKRNVGVVINRFFSVSKANTEYSLVLQEAVSVLAINSKSSSVLITKKRKKWSLWPQSTNYSS